MNVKVQLTALLLVFSLAAAQTPEEAALAAAEGTSAGTVTVLATWGGSELESFRAMVAPY